VVCLYVVYAVVCAGLYSAFAWCEIDSACAWNL